MMAFCTRRFRFRPQPWASLPCAAALSLILAACQPVATPTSASQCPAFQHIDIDRLPTHLNNDPDDERFETLWDRWAAEPSLVMWRTASPSASVHILASPGALHNDVIVREVIARRSAQGWEIYAREQDRAYDTKTRTPWREVAPSDTGSDRLDAVLGDPCLWSAPRFLYDQVPLLNGRWDSRPDGPSTAYDVSLGNQRWGGWHFSWTVGPPGRLRAILLSEAFGLPEWVDSDIGPDGWLDQPS